MGRGISSEEQDRRDLLLKKMGPLNREWEADSRSCDHLTAKRTGKDRKKRRIKSVSNEKKLTLIGKVPEGTVPIRSKERGGNLPFGEGENTPLV